jgi:hypothetical protein
MGKAQQDDRDAKSRLGGHHSRVFGPALAQAALWGERDAAYR